mgnify:CR=1 FL=1
MPPNRISAVEAETALEDMRSQVIDSTFKAMELEKQMEDLRLEAQKPWWKKIFSSGPKEDGQSENKK